MKSKILIWILVFVCVCSVCFGGGKQEGKEKAVTISLWKESDLKTPLWKELIASFQEENPNIKIDFAEFPSDDFDQKLLTAGVIGETSHLASMQNDYLNALIRQDSLVPAPKEIQSYIEQNFNGLDAVLYKGKIYSIPMAAQAQLMYYNKDILQSAGVSEQSLPRLWSELVSLSKKLTKYDGSGNVLQAGFGFNGRGNGMFEAYITQLGGRIYSKTEPVRYVYNSKQGHDAWKFMYDLVHTHKVNSTTFPSFRDAFGNGKAAFTWCWTWFGGFINGNFPAINWGAFHQPLPDGHPFYQKVGRYAVEFGVGVMKGHPEDEERAAWMFFDYMTKADNFLTENCKIGSGEFPFKKSIIEKKPQDLWENAEIRLLEEVLPYHYFQGEEVREWYWENLIEVEDRIIRQKRPITEVLEWSVQQSNKILDDLGEVYVHERDAKPISEAPYFK